MPASLRAQLLCQAHHQSLAGNSGERKIYECGSAMFKHQRHLELFPPTGPLEFDTIDILGPFPKTKTGNQSVVITTDR